MATTKDTGVTVDAANVINDILPFCAQGQMHAKAAVIFVRFDEVLSTSSAECRR